MAAARCDGRGEELTEFERPIAGRVRTAGTDMAEAGPCPACGSAIYFGGQFSGGCGTCIVINTIGAPPVGMTWCGTFAGTMSMSPTTTACELPPLIEEPARLWALVRFSATSAPPVTMLPAP